MSVSPLEGYLTKKEIEEKYDRSHRSVTRDFSNAVRVGDSEVLSHLKLRTDDGKELAGTEVTLELIQELSNKGLSPTWYAKEEWAEEKYSKEATTSKPVKPEKEKQVSPVEEKPVASTTDNELVRTMKGQITRLEQENDRRVEEHQKDKESFMKQIEMFKNMFDTLKEDHTDTKSLLKEVHQVMGKLADVSLLGSSSTTPSTNPKPETEAAASEQSKVVDVNADATVDAVIIEEPKKAKRKSTQKRNSKSQKKKPTAKPPSKPKPKQHKWYETPTLNKFLSRHQ